MHVPIDAKMYLPLITSQQCLPRECGEWGPVIDRVRGGREQQPYLRRNMMALSRWLASVGDAAHTAIFFLSLFQQPT